MEKSIEQMWSNGFLKNEKLLAPKINDLYNHKSQLLIEKFKRTYDLDNKGLLPLAILSVVGFGYFDYVILGVFLMMVMLGLYFLNKKKLNALERIEINSSSYEYLIKYNKTLNDLIRSYTKMMAFGFPVVGMIGYYLFFRNTEVFEKFMHTSLFIQVLILVGITLFLSGMGVGIYRLVTKMVYGRFLKKLDELITDMDTLRQ